MNTSSITLRADGRAHSGYSHTLALYPRRRWRTVRSYTAMAWKIAAPAVRIIAANLAGLAVLVTVGAALFIWSPQ